MEVTASSERGKVNAKKEHFKCVSPSKLSERFEVSDDKEMIKEIIIRRKSKLREIIEKVQVSWTATKSPIKINPNKECVNPPVHKQAIGFEPDSNQVHDKSAKIKEIKKQAMLENAMNQ